MTNAFKTYLTGCVYGFLLFGALHGSAQRIGETPPRKSTPSILINSHPSPRVAGTELCDNMLDDDGNGLIDNKDFSCYYNNNIPDCVPVKVTWAVTWYGLYWIDLETGEERKVGDMDGIVMYDISWSSTGKLYAVSSGGGVYEIDPYTSATTLVSSVPGYYGANAMTSDAAGNLYIAVFNNSWDIVKFNIATHATTLVAHLGNFNSGGDLAFLDGELYLSSAYDLLLRININTGAITPLAIKNVPPILPMSMITLGDGNLYLSGDHTIYRLDMTTMTADAGTYYTYQTPDLYVLGLSNYLEHCNAPSCKAKLNISILSTPPFCNKTGVLLRANGSGILGQSAYRWTLPDGSHVENDSLVAYHSGRYYVKYTTVPDTCGKMDSVDLLILDSPSPDLDKEAVLCEGTTLDLEPGNIQPGNSYEWNDGANTNPVYTVTQPGKYWLKTSNICGTTVDTVVVFPSKQPAVYLGADTLLCPGSSMTISNRRDKQPWDQYSWSNNFNGNSITVTGPGIYWLQSENLCGSVKDSLIVSTKDSCSCFPFYATANIGGDQEICKYEDVTLKNSSHREGYRYLWQNGSNAPALHVQGPGIYWVEVATYCNSARDTVIISSKDERDCIRNVYVPTAFTPNGDGKNDIFKPVIFGEMLHYEFMIYNRWGQVLFTTRDTGKGWDGKFLGSLQDNGAFIWICNYQFAGEEKVSRKGLVVLVK